MTGRFFGRQLAIYAAYHRDARNKATHFIGIPAIVLSLLIALALWRLRLGGVVVSGALLVGALALLGWIALDVGVGLAMALVVAPMWWIAEWLASNAGATTVWIVFAALFVGGWVFQFVGHAYEGRRPALVDNLFQAFIGPMFLVAETFIALGLRDDLRRAVEGPHVAERAAAVTSK
jgi:uncharacterized membrane protein YGL010W